MGFCFSLQMSLKLNSPHDHFHDLHADCLAHFHAHSHDLHGPDEGDPLQS